MKTIPGGCRKPDPETIPERCRSCWQACGRSAPGMIPKTCRIEEHQGNKVAADRKNGVEAVRGPHQAYWPMQTSEEC